MTTSMRPPDRAPADPPEVHRTRRDAAARGGRQSWLLGPVDRDRRVGLVVALVAAVGWGLLAALQTPRGPLTTGQALTTLAVSSVVGGICGLGLRSRWALLLAPLVFVLVVELVRLPVVGPSVDAPHLSTYGLIALVTGRGWTALVALLPMVLGAALGAGAARRRWGTEPTRTGGSRAALVARRVITAVTAVALLALAVGIARPARTDPIVGPDGSPLPGSIAELTSVEVGGHDLSMMVRGRSTTNPVLLFLAGGPGGTELGAMRHHGSALEEDFVVVTLDQRGTGKSYASLDPTDTLTLDRAVADVLEVTDGLRARFGQDRIHLLGQSWGTILGVLAVQRQPSAFTAFIGTGQMVSPRETDRVFYDDTLAWAERTGNRDLVDTLQRIGPPPYASILDYEPALSYEQEVYPYDRSGNAEGSGQMSEGILVGEYSLTEQVHNLVAFLDTFSVLYPQIQDVDLRRDAPRLDVPVYLFQGEHEPPGRAALADAWFAALQAPRKAKAVAATSGHRPLWEQPTEFAAFVRQTVLAPTAPPG